MYKVKRFIKKLFTPVSIMLIPHDSKRTINLKLPSIGIVASVALWFVGTVYVVSAAINTLEYYRMKDKLNFYTAQFIELRSTISTLKQAEAEFSRLLAFKSKGQILENVEDRVNTQDAGSIDMEVLKGQIKNSVNSVWAIKEFLKEQKDIYLATPAGWPVEGRVTSGFGPRENPKGAGTEFHSGLDISVPMGTPVKATAEGVVSFAGWSGGNGNLVVVEHGLGYSTFYAHNSSLSVSVGKRIKRGDIIAYSGSTGNSTGPHVHYEVWHNGKAINPQSFTTEAKNVLQEK
ncbi:MAG TPA: M23 family metallopeptidase [Dissulfurispiraceae bacterium]